MRLANHAAVLIKRLFATPSAAGVWSRVTAILGLAGSLALAARSLQPTQFGIVATLMSIIAVMLVADFGVGSWALGLLAREGLTDASTRKVVQGGQLLILLTLCWGTAICAVVASGSASEVLGAPRSMEHEAGSALLAFWFASSLVLFAVYITRCLYGLDRGVLASWSEASGSTVGLLATAVASTMHSPSPALFILSTSATPALGPLVVLALGMRRGSAGPWKLTAGSRVANWISVLRSSRHFFAINVGMAVALSTDVYVCARVLGPETAASYAVAIRLFAAFRTASARALLPIWPATSARVAAGNYEGSIHKFRSSWLVTSLTGATVSACVASVAPWIIAAWVGATYVGPSLLYISLGLWFAYAIAMLPPSLFLNGWGVINPQVPMYLMLAISSPILMVVFALGFGVAGLPFALLAAHITCVGIPTCVLIRGTIRKARQPTEG